jgi:hypothetical protein
VFDGLHDEVDCRHHGEPNDRQEKQYLSRFAEHVRLHHREGLIVKINGALAGAIKLPFRKLNLILCAQVSRPAPSA